jgi:hypothetical protein
MPFLTNASPILHLISNILTLIYATMSLEIRDRKNVKIQYNAGDNSRIAGSIALYRRELHTLDGGLLAPFAATGHVQCATTPTKATATSSTTATTTTTSTTTPTPTTTTTTSRATRRPTPPPLTLTPTSNQPKPRGMATYSALDRSRFTDELQN